MRAVAPRATRMVLHASRTRLRGKGTLQTTLCGRMSNKSEDGMNIADCDKAVTCKLCRARLRAQQPQSNSVMNTRKHHLAVTTYTPEKYLLINTEDGSAFRGVRTETGSQANWKAVDANSKPESAFRLTMVSGVARTNDYVVGTFTDATWADLVGKHFLQLDAVNHPEYSGYRIDPIIGDE